MPISENTLLGIFTDLEVVAILRFWAAGEDLVVDGPVGGIDPAAERTSIDVWAQTEKRDSRRSDPDGVCVGEGLG